MNKDDISEITRLTRLGLDEKRRLDKHKQREKEIQESLEKAKAKNTSGNMKNKR